MSLTSKLAMRQLKNSPKRTIWAIVSIILSTAMLGAVSGFAASGIQLLFPDYSFLELMSAGGSGLLMLVAILGAIIAVATIVVITNVFRVSAGERMRQFGLLKSVGATKKQITATVMYEGLHLSVMGIPLGIIVSLGVNFTVLSIINHWLEPINSRTSDFAVYFPFVFFPLGLVLAAVGSFVIVLISAWLPARKAAIVPAINAITHTSDIKLNAKKLQIGSYNGMAGFFFGAEGHLAAKQLKRNRRNFRAVVISLTISIVILLASASFLTSITNQTNMRFFYVDADVAIIMFSSTSYIPESLTTTAQEITQQLQALPHSQIHTFGRIDYSLVTTSPDQEVSTIRILVLEPELYTSIVEQAGAAYGSNILINARREVDIFGVSRDTHPFGHFVGQNLEIYQRDPQFSQQIHIDGYITSRSNDLIYLAYDRMTLIVPNWEVIVYEWLVLTDYPEMFTSYANDNILLDIGPNRIAFASNVSAMMSETRVMRNLFSLFAYGFAGMLTLIGLTNVISTISANTRLRAREFAVLKSTGMTSQGIGKMLALESLLSSFRSLCLGIPLGLAAAYGVYLATQMGSVRFPFILPWEMLIVCVVGVFTITFTAMQFSASRLRGRNIIETIFL